jgi:phage gpG-like protein
MPVRGDIGAVKALKARIKKVTTGGSSRRELHKLLAEEALTQVANGFRQSRDPYGRPWKPLKRRVGQPLRDTGRLLNSFHTKVDSRGFEVLSDVFYAQFHQEGTRRIPRRQMLPSPGELGRIWRPALQRVIRTWMEERTR